MKAAKSIILIFALFLIPLQSKTQISSWIEISREGGIRLSEDFRSSEWADGGFISQIDMPSRKAQACFIINGNTIDSVFQIDTQGRIFLMNVEAFKRKKQMTLRLQTIDYTGNCYECDLMIYLNLNKVGEALFIPGSWQRISTKL